MLENEITRVLKVSGRLVDDGKACLSNNLVTNIRAAFRGVPFKQMSFTYGALRNLKQRYLWPTSSSITFLRILWLPRLSLNESRNAELHRNNFIFFPHGRHINTDIDIILPRVKTCKKHHYDSTHSNLINDRPLKPCAFLSPVIQNIDRARLQTLSTEHSCGFIFVIPSWLSPFSHQDLFVPSVDSHWGR